MAASLDDMYRYLTQRLVQATVKNQVAPAGGSLFGYRNGGVTFDHADPDWVVLTRLIDGAHEIDPVWVVGKQHIGLTAGASAPQVLVDGVLERLRELGAGRVSELDGEPESMVFALPKELRLRLVG